MLGRGSERGGCWSGSTERCWGDSARGRPGNEAIGQVGQSNIVLLAKKGDSSDI